MAWFNPAEIVNYLNNWLEFPWNRKLNMRFYVALVIAVLARSAAAEESTDFVHPGILHNRAEITFVKSKITAGEEPWDSAWQRLLEHRWAKLDWRPKPRPHVQRGPYNSPNIGGDDMLNDAAAAYTHALAWSLFGKSAHAEKAIEILDAWSSTLESVSHHDAKLLVGMAGINFINAAELIRHSDAGWKQSDQERFERMLREIFYPWIKGFYPTASGNWDASMIQTMLAMGVFLDDREIFDRGVNYYRNGRGNGRVTHYFSKSGQCQETGRDQDHTQMGLCYLSRAAEIAWKQGVDLYAAADNRLVLGYEYTAKYNLGHEVPYEPFRSVEGRYNYKNISKRGPLDPIYEIVYHHYHDRLGMEMPFTAEAVARTRGKAKFKKHLTPWTTLMFGDLPK